MAKTISMYPLIRIHTTDNQILMLNLNQCATLQVERDAKCTRPRPGITQVQEPADLEHYTTDVLRVFFPQGTGLRYEVGREITADDFIYILGCLSELTYATKAELDERTDQEARRKLQEWNATMGGQNTVAEVPADGA